MSSPIMFVSFQFKLFIIGTKNLNREHQNHEMENFAWTQHSKSVKREQRPHNLTQHSELTPVLSEGKYDCEVAAYVGGKYTNTVGESVLKAIDAKTQITQ